MALEIPPEALPVQAVSSGRSVGLISLAVLFISITFAVAGQFTLKAAMTEIGRIGKKQVAAPMKTVTRALKEPRLWLGLTLFGVSAVFWLVVLSRVPLSVAYPLAGLQYVIVVALAHFLRHEHVPALRWLGVAVVALGIALVGLSFKRVTGA